MDQKNKTTLTSFELLVLGRDDWKGDFVFLGGTKVEAALAHLEQLGLMQMGEFDYKRTKKGNHLLASALKAENDEGNQNE